MTDIRSPLVWPPNVPRSRIRGAAKFGRTTGHSKLLSFSQATDRLMKELRLMSGVSNVVVSANVKANMDLRADTSTSTYDPGVALYFDRAGKRLCFPCDRWNRSPDNLAAIAAHLGAMRGQERWGVGTQEQAFLGYQAITAGWRAVLGDQPSLEKAKERARELASKYHPDRGAQNGANVEKFREVNEALAAAKKEFEP